MKECGAGNYSWSLCVNTHPSFVGPPSILFFLKACLRARRRKILAFQFTVGLQVLVVELVDLLHQQRAIQPYDFANLKPNIKFQESNTQNLVHFLNNWLKRLRSSLPRSIRCQTASNDSSCRSWCFLECSLAIRARYLHRLRSCLTQTVIEWRTLLHRAQLKGHGASTRVALIAS